MEKRTFEDGYREGWTSVAGDEPLPASRTEPLVGTPRTFKTGFRYGREDALQRMKSGS